MIDIRYYHLPWIPVIVATLDNLTVFAAGRRSLVAPDLVAPKTIHFDSWAKGMEMVMEASTALFPSSLEMGPDLRFCSFLPFNPRLARDI